MNDEEYILRNAKPTTVWEDLLSWYAGIRKTGESFALDLTEDDMP